MKNHIIVLFIFMFAVSIAYGQGGIIDNSFGKGGSIVHNLDGMDNVYDIKVLPDDRFLATGISGNRLVVARFFKNGAIDKAFGMNGFNRITFPSPFNDPTSKGAALTLQADGSIIVVGNSYFSSIPTSGNNDYAIAKLTANGILDATFGNSGTVTVAVGSQDYATDVAIQTDGKIIVGGYSSKNYGIVRLNANGTLDNSFNGTGILVAISEGYGGDASSILLLPDGKITIMGDVNLGVGYDIRMIRYNTDGTLDNSFGNNGVVTTDISYREVPKAAVLLADGSILVSGLVRASDGDDDILLKYKPDGTLDPSFGINGYVTLGMLPGSDDMANDLVVQPDGKIVIAGRTRFNNGTGVHASPWPGLAQMVYWM